MARPLGSRYYRGLSHLRVAGHVTISTTTPPVRVLHLTDPHLFADPAEALRGTVTFASLKAVIQQVRQASWQADQLALTGDLVQDDSAAAYDNLKLLIQTLALPTLVVPGNHDVRPIMTQALTAPDFDYCGSVRQRDWLLLGVDSCVDGSAGGRVSRDELDRMHATIVASDATHALICLHHPPLPLGSRWLDSVGLENGPDFLAAVRQTGRVRGVIFGHAHQAFDSSIDGLRIIGTPSTCRQFKPGSDEFALDDMPPAYRRIELHDSGSIETELHWVEAAATTEQRKS